MARTVLGAPKNMSGEGEALGGILCMSGYLPKRSAYIPSHAGLATPTALFHGLHDEVVQHSHAETTLATLQGSGVATQLTSYRGLGHSASLDELNDVIDWIKTLNRPP